jgi:hypothetical protein
MSLPRVLASATVDKVQDVPRAAWSVAVCGGPTEGPMGYEERVYRIEAASDTWPPKRVFGASSRSLRPR